MATSKITQETVDNPPLSVAQLKIFPLLQLPILVLEKIMTLISNPFDLKAARCCCKVIRDIIARSPDCLIHLRVTPKDLNMLEQIVENESGLKWNHFHIPPELYYVGCRRQYLQTFNQLISNFAKMYAPHIEILEMDRFDMNNPCHLELLRNCKKLRVFKVDNMMLKRISHEAIDTILSDTTLGGVLQNLEVLDVVAFEFLEHSYQFQFMGRLLEKCSKLKEVGSWGYFPEWEQPTGGATHLKYLIWPLLQYLRKRIKIVELMLESVETYQDFVELNLEFLNENMDWQAGKWVVNLEADSEDLDYSGLENFLYSRIKCYQHRAVGWFDENEFKRCGFPLMKNLTTVHIHNTRDINLTDGEENYFSGKPLFTKLENLTLIAGNRLSSDQDNLPLEKVVVDMLLNTRRPSVKTLKLNIDLDHHDEYGSISLPVVIQNFENLTSFCVEEWGPSDIQLLAIYEAFPCLETLMFCGRNVTDTGFLGEVNCASCSKSKKGILQLARLQILKIFSVRLPPKNVFPWPIQENHRITDASFQAFRQLPLRKFHLLIKSETITVSGVKALLNSPFSTSAVEFLINWLPPGIENANSFEQLSTKFKFLDPQTFLEPANFVIPDIGKWVL